MINKRVLDFYIDRKRRNYPSNDDLKIIEILENLFQYSNWIDKVGKEKYENIMKFLGIPETDIKKYYNDYCEMKKSFSKQYVNIYPEIINNQNR